MTAEAPLYYTAPSQELFDEVKKTAIEIWNTYDDTYNYATEKINSIKDIENIRDNFMYMVAMFDDVNQSILATKISQEAGNAIFDRMVSGGMEPYYASHFLIKGRIKK